MKTIQPAASSITINIQSLGKGMYLYASETNRQKSPGDFLNNSLPKPTAN